MDLEFNQTNFKNQSRYFGHERPHSAQNEPFLNFFPLDYRIVATVLQAVIYIFGFFGNILLIYVVRRTPSLHTPTYCYLVSLACADLIVLVSAVPEAIVSNHLYIRQWVLGQAGCSILVFGSFLGINAGSMSIVTFSIERYIAVCHTMLAQKICTMQRAKRITIAVWIFCVLYCLPWLGLTQTKPFPRFPDLEFCDFRLSREQYAYYFIVDITLFYFVPLILAVYLYVKIAQVLRSSHRLELTEESKPISSNCFRSGRSSMISLNCIKNNNSGRVSVRVYRPTWRSRSTQKVSGSRSSEQNRPIRPDNSNSKQAIQMLATVVILFAISWLPFRGVLIYNTFSKKPWLNNWYQLFAKCAIYVNCSVNPLLYNAMSRRFRSAFLKVLRCPTRKPEEELSNNQSNFTQESNRNKQCVHQTELITEEGK